MTKQVKSDHPSVVSRREKIRDRMVMAWSEFQLKIGKPGGPHVFDPEAMITDSDVTFLQAVEPYVGKPAANVRTMLAQEFRTAARSVKIKAALSVLALALLAALAPMPASAEPICCMDHCAPCPDALIQFRAPEPTPEPLELAAKPAQKCPGLSDKEINQRADGVVKYVREAISDNANRQPRVVIPGNRVLFGPLEAAQAKRMLWDILESACAGAR